jgi:polysaccharide biosynthesis protein PslE
LAVKKLFVMVTPVLRIDPKPKTSRFDNYESLNVGDLLAGAWKYRKSAIVSFLVLVPLITLIVFIIPARFDSHSQLLVRLGRGAVSVDPTANLSQTISLQESRLAQVNSVKELLFSREVFERVVRKIGPDRILEPHGIIDVTMSALVGLIPKSGTKPLGELSTDQVEDQIKLEEACKALYSAIKVSSPKEAYTISLEIRTGDPFLSRDIMHAYVEEYQKFHVESHQASGSLEFFEEQAEDALVRATEKQASLRDAKTTRGIVELSATKLSLSGSISTVKQELLKTDGELAATYAELEKLQSQIAELPASVESEVVRGIAKVAGSANVCMTSKWLTKSRL